MTQDYRVLLYYQYVPIEDGETFVSEFKKNINRNSNYNQITSIK